MEEKGEGKVELKGGEDKESWFDVIQIDGVVEEGAIAEDLVY